MAKARLVICIFWWTFKNIALKKKKWELWENSGGLRHLISFHSGLWLWLSCFFWVNKDEPRHFSLIFLRNKSLQLQFKFNFLNVKRNSLCVYTFCSPWDLAKNKQIYCFHTYIRIFATILFPLWVNTLGLSPKAQGKDLKTVLSGEKVNFSSPDFRVSLTLRIWRGGK